MNACLLSHSVLGILLRLPEEIKTHDLLPDFSGVHPLAAFSKMAHGSKFLDTYES